MLYSPVLLGELISASNLCKFCMVRTAFKIALMSFIILSENCCHSEGELNVLLVVLPFLVEGFVVGQKMWEVGKWLEIF